uniref:Uncharacterized protein n=1 Tax=Macaca fascicularis TaxID=9541 RepID=A0A7N9CH75_MACFA
MTGTCHHARLTFVFLVETGFPHAGQAGLKLLTSSNPPTSTSQSAGITGVSHHAGSGYPFVWMHQGLFLPPPADERLDSFQLGAIMTKAARNSISTSSVKIIIVKTQVPGQHGETPSLLKIQKLAERGGVPL